MQNSKNELRKYFSKRFDVEEDYWSHFKTHEKGSSIWISSKEIELLNKFVASGLRALRIMDYGYKPTTYILRFLDDKIGENIVDLEINDLKKLVLENKRIEHDVDDGYVALRFRNSVIGCGLKDSNGLQSRIPKGLARELEEIL